MSGTTAVTTAHSHGVPTPACRASRKTTRPVSTTPTYAAAPRDVDIRARRRSEESEKEREELGYEPPGEETRKDLVSRQAIEIDEAPQEHLRLRRLQLQRVREGRVLDEDAHDRRHLEKLFVRHAKTAQHLRAIEHRELSVVHYARGVRDELLVQAGDLALVHCGDLTVEHDLGVLRVVRHVEEVARYAPELLAHLDEYGRRRV